MHYDDWTDFIIENSLVNKPNKNGLTPIFFCQNLLSFLKLLSNGADINFCNKENKNAFFFNYIDGEAIIRNYIEHGLSLNQIDSEGYSIFNYSLFNKYPKIFMEYKDLIKLKTIAIDTIYINSYSNLKILIDNNFDVVTKKEMKINFSTHNNFLKGELNKNLDFIKSTQRITR